MTEHLPFGQEPTAEQKAYREALFLESQGKTEAAQAAFQQILPNILAEEEGKPPTPANIIVRVPGMYEPSKPRQHTNEHPPQEPTIREQAFRLEQSIPKN